MPKIIFLNGVNDDGMGDFYHFVDIYTALKTNPKFDDYEFICLIACYPHQYTSIKKQLDELQINPDHYVLGLWSSFREEFLKNEKIVKHFSEAEQILQISYSNFPSIEEYLNLNKKASYKFIPEHEFGNFSRPGSKGAVYSLGLGSDCLGVKLKAISRLTPYEAMAGMQKAGSDFPNILLENTESKDIKEFVDKNFLIPAYFNKMRNFLSFLYLLGANETGLVNKDLAVFVSGAGLREKEYGESFEKELKKREPKLNDLSDFAFWFRIDSSILKETSINKVELIENGKQPVVLRINPEGSRKIRVFYGYFLDKESYQATYRQAFIAGVSGDNSLELAISCQTLPWYCSTNSTRKINTNLALVDLINRNIMDEKIKKDFERFFFNKSAQSTESTKDQLDLPNMALYWMAVAEYLIRNRNFYNELERIMLDNSCVIQEDNSFEGDQPSYSA